MANNQGDFEPQSVREREKRGGCLKKEELGGILVG